MKSDNFSNSILIAEINDEVCNASWMKASLGNNNHQNEINKMKTHKERIK